MPLSTDELGHLLRYVQAAIAVETARLVVDRVDAVEARDAAEAELWKLALEEGRTDGDS
jgi:hypothetical protein